MNLHHAALLLHVLAATIWTGGHLVLALAVLPRVLRERSPQRLREFEAGYERVGMPALLVQVASGLWLAHQLLPAAADWRNFASPVTQLVLAKLALLAATAVTAVHARLFIIPTLSEATLPRMARRIGFVTLMSVLFVAVGVGFRFGRAWPF
jgi:putative copper export protein